jgi:carboxypeptidase Q
MNGSSRNLTLYKRVVDFIGFLSIRTGVCCMPLCQRFATISLAILLVATASVTRAQSVDPAKRTEVTFDRLIKSGLTSRRAHAMLTELCTKVGPRLSGSPGAEKAVTWAKTTMEGVGLERVRLEPVMVPHWVRGAAEEVSYSRSTDPARVPLRACALGGSVGTPAEGVSGKVLEVHSFDELHAAGDKAKGKIIFFNRPFDSSHFDPAAAYVGAVGQRGSGAVEAARAGGIAALVRSMTSRIDNSPHTGSMGYASGVTKVPAAALSTIAANRLSALLTRDPNLEVHMKMSCQTLPDVLSHNVIGELTGREIPGEVVVIGGHLDSWDLAQGAHDDGAGCVQSIEALRVLKEMGLRPKRTIRAVMFMNEENGARGADAYAAANRPGETHIAAIESDAGGFLPLGFGVSASPAVFEKISRFAPKLEPILADRITKGGHGTDIAPLMARGVPGLELAVSHQRYFDFHHSTNDTIEQVDDRELELGAIAMAVMAYMIAEEGLPTAVKSK